MLFGRRKAPGIVERVRVGIWPRRSWRRSFQYILKRLSRIGATPHDIAIGSAVGALVSFTPFLGLHFIIAGILAWLVGGSVIAAALATFIGNPLTFPIIWISSYKLGSWLLGGNALLDGSGLAERLHQLSSSIVQASWDAFWPLVKSLWPIVLKPMTIGGMPMGIVASIIVYYIVRRIIEKRGVSRGI